jgi:hypothetical protein
MIVFNQAERYKLWQKTISLLIVYEAISIFCSRSLEPKIRQTLLMFPKSMLNLIIVLTTVPYGALVSSIASEKSKPVAHL